MSKLKEIKKQGQEKKPFDFTILALVIAAGLILFMAYSYISNPNPNGGEVNGDIASDDPFKGPANAKVAMVEFSDFECPACGTAYGVIKQIAADYDGRIKIVYRDFPLTQHTFAFKSAEAGNCANEQGKFWEMHDIMFENQSALTISSLKKYAADIGLNTEQFNSCLDSGKYAAEVSGDIADGASFGVAATPTFFINNKKYSNMSYAQFKAVIDAELAK